MPNRTIPDLAGPEIIAEISKISFDGVFRYETRSPSRELGTTGHVIFYSPNDPPPNPDGSQIIKMAFPALSASYALAEPERFMPLLVASLNHAGDLARAAAAFAGAIEALELYDAWAATPQDRGGGAGHKAQALAAFIAAKDAALAKCKGAA